MANPKTLRWSAPATFADGSPYGESDHAGFDIEVNGAAALAVPVSWNTSGAYELPLAQLPGIKRGSNVVRMRTVAKNGSVSVWTAALSFEYAPVPLPPTNLAAA